MQNHDIKLGDTLYFYYESKIPNNSRNRFVRVTGFNPTSNELETKDLIKNKPRNFLVSQIKDIDKIADRFDIVCPRNEVPNIRNNDVLSIEYFSPADSMVIRTKENLNINRLQGQRTYLAGSIDRNPDGGLSWRKEITPLLQSMGVIVMDPLKKPIHLPATNENIENRELRHKYKNKGRFDHISKDMKIIRQIDLRMVDVSDFIIVCLDMDIHATGTYEEIFLANRQKKAILVWVPQGKVNAPDWLFTVLPHQLIFGDRKSMINYLEYVNNAVEVETLNRWVFFNY